MKRMLVLYRELAGYFVHCMRHLADVHEVEIDIVAYPVNAEAPFEFDFGDRICVYRRSEVDALRLEQLPRERHYNLIFCGGWTDADYLNCVKRNPNTPALVGFDKQWLGSWRDRLSALKARFAVRPLFDYAFVPGTEQVVFARKMGFADHQIVTGAYACEVERFNAAYTARSSAAWTGRKQLWFAGRYVDQKDIRTLVRVVSELLDREFPDWEFHGMGTGQYLQSMPKHDRMFHHGFVQPGDMPSLIEHGALFVLPSIYEPWGVVVQEFAVSGFALLLSDKVGARTAFLEEGRNGGVFQAGDADALKQLLHTWMSRSAEQLLRAGQHSRNLALRITPETYAQSILQMMERSK
jgi:glycosyltransferase involved in cell wall biosynthesis